MSSMASSPVIAERSKKASTNGDKPQPTSQGKKTAHNTNPKTSPLDTNKKGREHVSDQQRFQQAKNLDKMGQCGVSTAMGRPPAAPATGERAVARKPSNRTDAESAEESQR